MTKTIYQIFAELQKIKQPFSKPSNIKDCTIKPRMMLKHIRINKQKSQEKPLARHGSKMFALKMHLILKHCRQKTFDISSQKNMLQGKKHTFLIY